MKPAAPTAASCQACMLRVIGEPSARERYCVAIYLRPRAGDHSFEISWSPIDG